MKQIKSAFGKCAKSSACWVFGTMMAALTVICTPGCDKSDNESIEIDDNKVKDALLVMVNDSFKSVRSEASMTGQAVKVQDLVLVQKSEDMRVGYANILCRGREKKSGQETEGTLHYDVKLLGPTSHEEFLLRIELDGANMSQVFPATAFKRVQ